MKMKMRITVLSLALISTSLSFAATHNYACISQQMEAFDSDVYYDLSAQEIDQMLADPAAMGHDLAVRMAQVCDSTQQ